MLQKLQAIDRRIIYLLFAIITALPFINPVSLPVTIADWTKSTYDLVQSLKPGDTVLVDIRFSPASAGEMNPPYQAILRHIAAKPGVKVLWFCTTLTGQQFQEQGIELMQSYGRVYGKDLVGFGYLAGEETACAAVAQDLRKAFPMDSRGNKIDSLEAVKNVNTAKDIAMILQCSDGGMGVLTWVRQGYLPFGTKVVAILGQIMVPSNLPYYQGKQAAGLISGLQGAAEYETLLNQPARGMASLGAQTFAHIYVIGLLLIVNAAYLIEKSSKGGKAK